MMTELCKNCGGMLRGVEKYCPDCISQAKEMIDDEMIRDHQQKPDHITVVKFEAGEDLKCGDIVHVAEGGKLYKVPGIGEDYFTITKDHLKGETVEFV